MQAPVSRRVSPHGLIGYLQTIFISSRLSMYALQRMTGISAATIRRIMDSNVCREIGWLEILLDQAGITLLARTADRPWEPLPSLLGFLGLPCPPHRAGFRHAIMPLTHHATTSSGDGILLALRQVIPAESRQEIRSATRNSIPPQALNRMLGSDFMRVGTYAQMLLSALGGSLCLVTAHGDAAPVPSPHLDPDRGLSLCLSHRAMVRKSARSHPQPQAARPAQRQRSRALFGKQEILRLYEEYGLDHREISILAGVSRERIRQVLATMGAEPIRERRKRLHLQSIGSTFALVPISRHADVS